MRQDLRIAVVIPAYNEAPSIGKVLDSVPHWVDMVIVADNGSADATRQIARDRGAKVIEEPRRGYGSACLAGIDAVEAADIVVFLDGDYSDYPEQMNRLVDPIATNRADLVVGSRILGKAEAGALTPQAIFGNWLATRLLALFWQTYYTDLGPFRAIRFATLQSLEMADKDYGWTVEMQIKAALRGVRAMEVSVDYRRRIGKSKISGTIRGVFGAGYKILSTIAKAILFARRAPSPTREILVFTRYPEPGKAKTRLIPALGAVGAAALHRELAERAVNGVRRATRLLLAKLHILFEGGSLPLMEEWLGLGTTYAPQAGGDLGARLIAATNDAFRRGADEIVVMGSDCPDLNELILRGAFEALGTYDMVIGPAADGGYYLIGLRASSCRQAIPAVFQGLEWGSDSVYERTLEIARHCGLSVFSLPELGDIDRPEDLPIWQKCLERDREQPLSPRISVIIPALNEEVCIQETLRQLLRAVDIEIIVSDGGSEDETIREAEAAGAQVIVQRGGRAAQMNAAARIAKADALFFLHADTLPPPDWDAQIERLLSFPAVAVGAFAFSTDTLGMGMRVVAALVNLRSRWLSRPYGDQGIFIRKSTFEKIGGYPDLPIMEDFAFIRSAARLGKVVIAPSAVTTSARRWKRLGILRTFTVNQICLVAYFIGVRPSLIARIYRSASPSRDSQAADQQSRGN